MIKQVSEKMERQRFRLARILLFVALSLDAFCKYYVQFLPIDNHFLPQYLGYLLLGSNIQNNWPFLPIHLKDCTLEWRLLALKVQVCKFKGYLQFLTNLLIFCYACESLCKSVNTKAINHCRISRSCARPTYETIEIRDTIGTYSESLI